MPTFAPGYRLAYDRDGSAVYRYDYDGAPNHPPSTDWKLINNEADTGISAGNMSTVGANVISSYLAVVFPAPTDLVGVYFAQSGSSNGYHWRYLEVSPDTTNGLDGTWTTVRDIAYSDTVESVQVNYRISAKIFALNNLDVVGFRAIKVGHIYASVVRAIHLYTSAQETFLKLWHPTLDQEISVDQLDWGTVYAGEVHTRQFRIKNLRGMTANNVSLDVLTYTPDDTNSTYHSFSLDGTTFARPLDIGNIAPGAISPLVTVRYAPPVDAVVSLYASQVSAIPGSWT